MATENINFTGQDIGQKACDMPFTGKKFEGLVDIPNPDNPKEIIKVKFFNDFSFDPPRPCFFYLSDNELINPIILNDMEKSGMGSINQQDAAEMKTFEYKNGIVICSNGSPQDIITEIDPFVQAYIAELLADGFVLPPGTQFGVGKLIMNQFTDKQPVICHAGENAGSQVNVLNETPILVEGIIGEPSSKQDLLVVNGGTKTYCRALLSDEIIVDGECHTCGKDGQQLSAGEVMSTGEIGTAKRVDFCLMCFIAPLP